MAINNTTTYMDKLKDPRWQKKRLEILQRDEWTCQRCYGSENTLTVHHRYYLSTTDPWDYPDVLLVTLCNDCHEHEKEEMPQLIEIVINNLKETFFSDEIYELAAGLFNINLVKAPELVAPAIGWVLTNRVIQKEIVERYWQQETERLKAERLANA